MSINIPSKNSDSKKRKWFTFSNALTFVMLVFVLAMIINPNVKAFVIQNLMRIGLFQPGIPSESENNQLQSIDEISAQGIVFNSSAGETVNLSQLKGKVVFLNFWATWCPPCIAEMPSIHRLKQRYKSDEDIVFLMVDADGDFQKSVNFMQKHNYDLPVYIPASQVPESIFGSSLPTTVVLDKKGNVVFKHEGSADYESPKFMKFINSLLAK